MIFKQVFRFTVLAYIWKRYKTIITSTLLLFLFFWIVSQVHADYVDYGNLNNDKQYIGLSFVIKWIAFISGVVVYFLVNSWAFRKAKRQKEQDKPLGKGSKSSKSSKNKADQKNQSNALVSDADDPFALIRQKDKLRSRADMIIEQHKPKQ